jgi:hypothetical protein
MGIKSHGTLLQAYWNVASVRSPRHASGRVHGQCYSCRRRKEFIPFLEHLDREILSLMATMHLVCDNLSIYDGQEDRK